MDQEGNQNPEKLIKNLYLIGPINESMVKEVIPGLLEDPNIDKLDILNLFVSSEGGSLHDCMAIIDTIEHLKRTVKFEVNSCGMGMVASGGVFLFLLGDNRAMLPSCRFFVHEHVCMDEEELPYSKKLSREKEDKLLNNMYVHYVARRLEISDRKARSLLKKDKWLTQRDLESYGLITGELK